MTRSAGRTGTQERDLVQGRGAAEEFSVGSATELRSRRTQSAKDYVIASKSRYDKHRHGNVMYSNDMFRCSVSISLST